MKAQTKCRTQCGTNLWQSKDGGLNISLASLRSHLGQKRLFQFFRCAEYKQFKTLPRHECRLAGALARINAGASRFALIRRVWILPLALWAHDTEPSSSSSCSDSCARPLDPHHIYHSFFLVSLMPSASSFVSTRGPSDPWASLSNKTVLSAASLDLIEERFQEHKLPFVHCRNWLECKGLISVLEIIRCHQRSGLQLIWALIKATAPWLPNWPDSHEIACWMMSSPWDLNTVGSVDWSV